MSLFGKKTCCRCGKESRLLSSFASQNGTIHLCDKCKEELHVQGYEDYMLRVLGKIATYEDLLAYSAYYISVMEDARMFRERNYPADMVSGAERLAQFFAQELKSEKLNGSVTLGNYRFNALYLTSHQYKDLVLRRSDINLVAVSTDFRTGNKHSGYDFITCMLFADNSIVPAFPSLFMRKSGLLDLMKAKAKQDAMTVLKLLYPGIQIDDAKQLRKQLRSGALLCSIDSKLMDNLINATYTNTGCCKGEAMLNDRTKYMHHAAQQDLQMGFHVPKSEL